jgi:hypothetical protein
MSISLGFDGYVGIAYPQSPIDTAGNAVMIKLGLRPGDSERKNGTGRSRTCPDREASHQAALGFPSTSRRKERLLHASPILGCNGRKVMDVWI